MAALLAGLTAGCPRQDASRIIDWRCDEIAASPSPAVRAAYAERMNEQEKAPRNPESLARLAGFYHANGFLKASLPLYEELQRMQPASPLWPYRIALVHLKLGDTDAALASLRATTERDPRHALAWLYQGHLLLYRSESAGAIGAFERALQFDPRLAHARGGIARVHMANRDWPAAKTNLMAAIVTDATLSVSYTLLAEVHRALGETALAVQVSQQPQLHFRYREPDDPVREALEAECCDVNLLRTTADMYFTSLRSEKAIPLLERALRLEPHNAEVMLALAKIHLADEHTDAAFDLLTRAIATNPRAAEPYYVSAFEQHRLKRFAAADAAASEGLRQNPGHAALFQLRGLIRRDLGELPAAEADLRQAIALAPNSGQAVRTLADLRWTAGQKDEAADLYRRTCTLAPFASAPRWRLATYHLERDEIESALGYVKEMLRLPPDACDLRRAHALELVRWSVSRDRRGQTAGPTALLDAALELDPASLPALEQLCAQHLRAREPERAQRALRDFIAANPNAAKPAYLLAVLLIDRGEKGEALRLLTAARWKADATADAETAAKIQTLLRPLAASR